MRVARPLVAAVVVAAAAPAAFAQPAPLAPGSRVRVTRDGGTRPQVGTLVALTRDTLVAHWAGGDTARVPLAGTTRLEVSRGRHHRPWRGAGLGLLAGVGVGALVGAATYQEPECSQSSFVCLDYGRGFGASAGALVFGSVGALVGGIVGATRGTEQWRPVALDGVRRVGLTVPQRGGGIAVAASLRF